MNRKRIVLIFFIVITMISTGCRKTIPVDQPVFTQDGSTLTNGTLHYVRLPKDWGFSSDYSYRIGTVKGGNALLASDENGTFVKERKEFLADVDFAPWVREDYVFPDVCGDDFIVEIYGRTHDLIILDGQAREEFIALLRSYINSSNEQPETEYEKLSSFGNPDILLNTLKYVGGEATLICISMPGLAYNPDMKFLFIDDKLHIAHRIGNQPNNTYVVGTFDEDSAIYQVVKESMEKGRTQ